MRTYIIGLVHVMLTPPPNECVNENFAQVDMFM